MWSPRFPTVHSSRSSYTPSSGSPTPLPKPSETGAPSWSAATPANRSGLVVAQTLIELSHKATTAVEAIRQKQSPYALTNQNFEEYLTTGLEVAYLLAGLDPAT